MDRLKTLKDYGSGDPCCGTANINIILQVIPQSGAQLGSVKISVILPVLWLLWYQYYIEFVGTLASKISKTAPVQYLFSLTIVLGLGQRIVSHTYSNIVWNYAQMITWHMICRKFEVLVIFWMSIHLLYCMHIRELSQYFSVIRKSLFDVITFNSNCS
jgi:hypothetical protein